MHNHHHHHHHGHDQEPREPLIINHAWTEQEAWEAISEHEPHAVYGEMLTQATSHVYRESEGRVLSYFDGPLLCASSTDEGKGPSVYVTSATVLKPESLKPTHTAAFCDYTYTESEQQTWPAVEELHIVAHLGTLSQPPRDGELTIPFPSIVNTTQRVAKHFPNLRHLHLRLPRVYIADRVVRGDSDDNDREAGDIDPYPGLPDAYKQEPDQLLNQVTPLLPHIRSVTYEIFTVSEGLHRDTAHMDGADTVKGVCVLL